MYTMNMAKSGKVGRPRKYNDKQVKAIIKKLEKYIKENDIPIIAEFAYKNNILKTTLYEYAEFATLLKKAIAKKESNLERGLLHNRLNAAGAIFSLKQLGWRDKQDISHSGEMKVVLESELDQDFK